MLTLFFDFESKIPLYEQLYHFIRKAIEDNELKANEKLPSKRKLAQHLKISVMTVETAYNQLMAEGYIRSVPKSGFYVLPYIQLISNSRSVHQDSMIQKPKKRNYQVDFRTNQVAAESFPYERFSKIEKEVMQYQYQDCINQTDYQGLYRLRQQIAELLFEYRGIIANPESIVIGTGSEHLISLLVLLLGRDHVFGVEEPGYIKNYHLYHDYGATAKTIPLDEQGIVLSSVRDVDVVHVTPSHQFPTGIVTTISRRMELLNWASEDERHYIIEDDYDSEFRFSGIPIPAMKSLDTLDKVIYMNSFSKSIAPSFRVSFMVLPDRLLEKYHSSYSYFTCSVPVMTQLVLEQFIKNKEYEKHLNRMKNIYKNKRDSLIDMLRASSFHEFIEIIGEESGLHFLMRLKTEESLQVFISMAEQFGIRLYGVNEYCLSKQRDMGQKTVVLGYSHLTDEDFTKAIKQLEKAWKNLF